MGQPSIPSLNRSGQSMFWISSWNDYYNFNKRFQEELFISKLTQSLIMDRISTNKFFWNSLKSDFSRKRTNIKDWSKEGLLKKYGSITNYSKSNDILPFLRTFYRIPVFHTRVSILNLSKYFILTLRLFHPLITDKKLFIRTKTFNYKKKDWFKTFNNYKKYINYYNNF